MEEYCMNFLGRKKKNEEPLDIWNLSELICQNFMSCASCCAAKAVNVSALKTLDR